MAEKRMFAKTIVLSDEFLDMPPTARCLYFTLSMLADDDGFCNAPRSIMRQCGASNDDMKILLAKKFVLAFDSGVIVIKHWRINNYLQADRYTPTKYKDEKAQLELDENKAYRRSDHAIEGDVYTECVYTDKVSIDKNSIDKISKDNSAHARFIKPTLEEVAEYCKERGNNVDPERFVDYYEGNGWKVGRNSMKDWKATVRTWEKNGFSNSGTSKKPERKEREFFPSEL